jgi:hypothetical protein
MNPLSYLSILLTTCDFYITIQFMTAEQKAYIRKHKLEIIDTIEKSLENGELDFVKFNFGSNMTVNIELILKPLVNCPYIFDVFVDIPKVI